MNVRASRRLPLQRVFLAAMILSLCASGTAFADGFTLGAASDYAVLFEGGGSNTLSITNVTTNTTGGNTGVAVGQGGGIGNIGVGGTLSKTTISGPSTINGRIDIATGNVGQFSNNNAADVFQGPNYNVAAVTSALNTVNALNTTLGALAGTNVSVNGDTTINLSAGTFSASGTGYNKVEVFNVISFSLNNGQTLTLNHDGGALGGAVVLNFLSSNINNPQIDGNVVLNGLSPDQVIFNFVGGSGLQNGPTLQINNGGGSPSHGSYLSQGIFLDPNGAVSVTNANITGRVFGGDSHDFQYVSGSNITAPTSQVPEPGSLLLFGTGLSSVAFAIRRRKK